MIECRTLTLRLQDRGEVPGMGRSGEVKSPQGAGGEGKTISGDRVTGGKVIKHVSRPAEGPPAGGPDGVEISPRLPFFANEPLPALSLRTHWSCRDTSQSLLRQLAGTMIHHEDTQGTKSPERARAQLRAGLRTVSAVNYQITRQDAGLPVRPNCWYALFRLSLEDHTDAERVRRVASQPAACGT